MKRVTRSQARRVTSLAASWSWRLDINACSVCVYRPEQLTTRCGRGCQLHAVADGSLGESAPRSRASRAAAPVDRFGSAAVAAGDAVDLRRPGDSNVEDGLIGGGKEVVQPLGAATLELLHQHAAVRQADHAELADEIGCDLLAHVVIEDEPAVQERSQAVAANLDRDRIFRRSGLIDLIEIALIHLVEVSLGTRADIAEHPYLGCRDLVRTAAGPHRLASGQQPFRGDPEAARIALGLVRAVVTAAGRFRPLVGTIGRNRDAHRLACQARGFVLLLARDA